MNWPEIVLIGFAAGIGFVAFLMALGVLDDDRIDL